MVNKFAYDSLQTMLEGDRKNKLFERVKVIKERSVDEAFTAFETFVKETGLADVKVLDVSEPN